MDKTGLFLPLRRSRLLVSYSSLIHVLALISIVVSHSPLLLKFFLSMAVLMSEICHFYQLGLIGNYQKIPVSLHQDNQQWYIRYNSHAASPVLKVTAVWSTHIAIIIHFESASIPPQSLIIFKDAMDKERFRQLRVHLRLAFFQK